MNLQTIGKLAVQMFLDPKGFEEGADQTTDATKALQGELNQLADEINGAVAGAMDKLTASTEKAVKAANELTGVYRDAAGKLRDANGKFVSGEAAIKALGDTAGLTADEIKALSEEADKANFKSASTAAESLLKSFGSLGDVLGGVVLNGLKAVGVAVAGLGAASAVVGAAFEQKMRQVGVIAGADEEAMASLTEEARRLGATTSFSASEAAEAMQLLASAGLDTQQIMEAAGQALVLAGAGGTDLNTAASAITSTLATFGLQAQESARIADVFAKATAGSQFQVEDLGEALKYGAPTAAAFGYSLEETVAAMAQFRDLGLQGSTAGTALRSVLSQASQQTKINADTLAKYNLQLSDVNPQLHSFGEILQTVGAVGMNAADAMVVFGVEGGGAFATMAQQVALGSTKLSEFQTSLTDAGGAATAMYASMQQTVTGAFAELQSAAEEVLLTLFEQYSGSLPDLLNGLTDFVNQVSAAVTDRSAEIQGALSNAVGIVTAYLSENGDALARSFADAVVSMAEFAQTLAGVATSLAGLIPYLDDIAAAMGVIWVASKVAAFASALSNVVTLFSAARIGLMAFMAQLTAATGGTYALVAAIGALVAGLVALIARYDEAEESARKLKAAQDALNEKRATATAERAAELDVVIQKQLEAAEAEADALAQAGQLTAEKKKELEALREMDGLTAARLEAEGKLLQVSGELKTVRQIVQGEDAAAFRQISTTVAELKTGAADATVEMNTLKAAIQRAQQQGLEGGTQQAVFFSSLGFDVASVEAAEAKIADLDKAKKASTERALALEKQLKDEVRALQDEATKETDDANKARLKSTQEAAAQAARSEESEQKKYTDQTRFMYEKLADELAALGATETDQLAIELARREREIKDAYARQIQEAEGNAAEQERLQKDLQDTLVLLAQYGAKRRTLIEEEERKKQDEQQKQDEQRRSQERQQERDRVLDILTNLEQRGASEVEKLQEEKAKVLAGIGEENADLRLKIEEKYLELIADAEKREIKARRQRWIDSAKQVADAFEKIVGAVQGAVTSGISLVETYLGKLLDLFETVTGFSFDLSGLVGDVQSAQDEAVDEGTTLSNEDAAAQVVDELVSGAVEFATLFGDIADDLISALVAGVPDLITAFTDNLPDIISAIADNLPLLVTEIISALPDIMTALVNGMGDVVDAIVKVLPDLADALVSMITTLLPEIAKNMETLILAIIDFVVAIVNGIADNIDTLIDPLINLLMTVLDAILDALPVLLPALIKIVLALVIALIKELPNIITAILEALPEIITSIINAIVEALPDLIDAIIEAIPDIIVAVINAVPDIIFALLKGVMSIIGTVLSKIPDIIMGLNEGVREIGNALMASISDGFEQTGDFFATMGTKIADWFRDIDLGEFAKDIGQAFLDGIKSVWDAIKDLFSDLFDGLFSSDDGGSRSRTNTGGSPMAGLADLAALASGAGGLPAGLDLGLGRGQEEGRGGRATGPMFVGSTARISVMLDGRTMQDSLVRSDARGQTTVVSESRRSGRIVGVDRGSYNKFSKT